MKNAFSLSSAAAALGMISMASAHMEMSDPAPFRSKYNSHATEIDYSMNSPLSPSGSDFPCKGFLGDLGTPAGASVAEWKAGESYSFTVEGSATHGGGSCQASLSYDGGSTWKVIQSYLGNCPLKPTWDFTVPEDAPGGDAVFAWTWFNNIGNREMYMNCAAVTIDGAEGGDLSGLPDMFVANVGNGCSTTEGTDVDFPNPGPHVEEQSSSLAPPTGNCGGGARRRHARSFRA